MCTFSDDPGDVVFDVDYYQVCVRWFMVRLLFLASCLRVNTLTAPQPKAGVFFSYGHDDLAFGTA